MILASDERWALIALLCVLVVGGIFFSLKGCGRPDAVEVLECFEETEQEVQAESEITITVHVAGAVREPGIFALPATSRVWDALEAAGGATPEAMPHALNLAEPLLDGQRVYVPTTSEVMERSADAPWQDTRVNINTADRRTLETLPGIGPSLAQRIIDYRAANGSFKSVEDLLKVSGIGSKTLERLKELATVR